MARVRTPARPEMVHENPVLAPLLIALLRESAKAIEAASQRGEDGHLPVGAASSRAMAQIVTTWADQIENYHQPDDPAPSQWSGSGDDDPGDF